MRRRRNKAEYDDIIIGQPDLAADLDHAQAIIDAVRARVGDPASRRRTHPSAAVEQRTQPPVDGVGPFDRSHVASLGFRGFVTFADLSTSEVDTGAGVYVVLRESRTSPQFLPTSGAGRTKGRDPSVSLETLRDAWVPDCEVVYIGREEIGQRGTRGIAKRLDEYRRHGAGEPVGHWGGRLVWQLADHADLVVAWRPDPHPARLEADLLDAFVERHGKLPFANRRRGDR